MNGFPGRPYFLPIAAVLAMSGMASTVALAQRCNPSFRSGTPLEFIGPREVVRAFDFNGDGRKDLLYDAPQSTSVALNAGNGRFNPPTEALPFNSIDPSYPPLAVGDMDGDGILDLVVVRGGTSPGTSLIRVYKGTGRGDFQDVSSTTVPANLRPDVLGDFDGNGTLDLAILVESSYVWIYPGDGRGGFGAPRTQVAPGFFSFQLWAADLNGDGRTDLLIAAYGFNSTGLVTWISGPYGFFTAISDGPQGGGFETGFDLALGDVDGDGRTDVVVVNGFLYAYVPGWGSIETSLARPGGFVVVRQAATSLASPVLADFDGDGRVDLAALEYTPTTSTLVIQLGDGAGTFGSPLRFPLPATATDLTAADFDGDGHVDLIVSGIQDRSPLLYRNACHPPGAHMSPIPGPAISPRPHGRLP
jgi:hypothetical protein